MNKIKELYAAAPEDVQIFLSIVVLAMLAWQSYRVINIVSKTTAGSSAGLLLVIVVIAASLLLTHGS